MSVLSNTRKKGVRRSGETIATTRRPVATRRRLSEVSEAGGGLRPKTAGDLHRRDRQASSPEPSSHSDRHCSERGHGQQARVGARSRDEESPNVGEHLLFSFLTIEPNGVVGPLHDKAMPVLIRTNDEAEKWLEAPLKEALQLQKPAPDDASVLLPEEKKRV